MKLFIKDLEVSFKGEWYIFTDKKGNEGRMNYLQIGGRRFDKGTIVVDGKKINGLNLSEENISQIKEAKEEVLQADLKIISDFLKTVKTVEKTNGIYSIPGMVELEKTLTLSHYTNEIENEFINKNKKFMVVLNHNVDGFGKAVLEIVESLEEVQEIQLTDEEAKKYNEKDLFTTERVVTIEDVDYGKIDKFYKVFFIKTKKTIRRVV